jgi:hypothetical protein
MMTVNLREAILAKAIEVGTKAREKYGNQVQDWMLVEECSELLTALARRERGRGTQAQVDEEIADVLFVCLGALSPDVLAVLMTKIERLEARL